MVRTSPSRRDGAAVKAAGRGGTTRSGRPAAATVDGRGPKRGGPARRPREGRTLTTLFLAPAAVMLTILVVYPMGYTIWLSLHGGDTGHWVGLDNYRTMFTSPGTRRAITNNIVWMLVAPTVVTALGLVLAVLTERLRLRTALRAVVFMPMAISFLAAGITFRMVYDESPDRGVVNAAIVAVHDAFKPPSKYHGATPREDAGLTTDHGAVVTTASAAAGEPVLVPLLGLPASRVPDDARPAQTPASTGLSGVVWLDFTRGGGGQPGAVDDTEPGLPHVSVEALLGGTVVGRTTTDAYGRFTFPELTGTGYVVRLPASNFTPPFDGLVWLGPGLVTPSVIGAYVWIWAGFAMVFIAAGLAAIPREALEAARMDGATEWQTFRLVTVPLLRPVLVVVVVTLAINVLKIFDLVYVLPPESAQDDATVIALEMYRVSFGGNLDYGLGSALGVLLFVLVLPAMLFNIRRLRRDQ